MLFRKMIRNWRPDPARTLKENEDSLRRRCSGDPDRLASGLFTLAESAVREEPDETLRLACESLILREDVTVRKWIAFRLQRRGALPEAAALLRLVPSGALDEDEKKRRWKIISALTTPGGWKPSLSYIPRELLQLPEIHSFLLSTRLDAVASMTGEVSSVLARKITADKNFFREFGNSLKKAADLGERILRRSGTPEAGAAPSLDRSQTFWIRQFSGELETLKVPGSSGICPPCPLRIALAADREFTRAVAPVADFRMLTAADITDGLAGEWDALILANSMDSLPELASGDPEVRQESRRQLHGLIRRCRESGIPAIFISTGTGSDPELEAETARETAFVFISDPQLRDRIRQSGNDSRLFPFLNFINPLTANPLGSGDSRAAEILMALPRGSFPEDVEQEAEILCLGATGSGRGFRILDGGYSPEGIRTAKSPLPPGSSALVSPAPDGDSLRVLCRLSSWSLVVCPGRYGPGGFPVRALESAAQGCGVLAGYTPALNSLLPEAGLIMSAEEASRILRKTSPGELYERRAAGIRRVLGKHTCFHRFREVFSQAGLGDFFPDPGILVLCDMISPEVEDSFRRQLWKEKKLLIQSELTPEILSRFTLVTWFSDDYFYEEHYLGDMASCFLFTSGSFVTRNTESWGLLSAEGGREDHSSLLPTGNEEGEESGREGGGAGSEFRMTDHYVRKDCTLFRISCYSPDEIASGSMHAGEGYVTDHLEILRRVRCPYGTVRLETMDGKLLPPERPECHQGTMPAPSADGCAPGACDGEPGGNKASAGAEYPGTVRTTKSSADGRRPRLEPLLSVIVPVYNNGAHLRSKCIESLRRSSLFPRMEIILVDDGSTDPETLATEDQLARHLGQIRLCRLPGGGSGSASRPRNRGVCLASAPCLTFLDPDNEAVNDGYSLLCQDLREHEADVSVGGLIKCWEDRVTEDSPWKKLMNTAGTDWFPEGLGSRMGETCFLSASIQAMVMRTSYIRNLGYEEVEGAAGQDTLFSWQLMHRGRIHFVDCPIHIYFAATEGSVTNTLGPGYFRKLLLLQEPKIRWLEDNELLQDYMDVKFSQYTTGWVFGKLARCKEGAEAECTRLVSQIISPYRKAYSGQNDRISTFLKLCDRGSYLEAHRLVSGRG